MVVASKEILIASLKFSSVYVNVLYRADLDRVLITMNRTKKQKTKMKQKKFSPRQSFGPIEGVPYFIPNVRYPGRLLIR